MNRTAENVGVYNQEPIAAELSYVIGEGDRIWSDENITKIPEIFDWRFGWNISHWFGLVDEPFTV